MAKSGLTEKWMQVITSAIKSSRGRKTNGPTFNASATEVDSVRYLSEYWDTKGFVREQILEAQRRC
jgi:hypothetical protein